jgi:hypothetical protein
MIEAIIYIIYVHIHDPFSPTPDETSIFEVYKTFAKQWLTIFGAPDDM